jgi:maleylacetate reductase
VLGPFAFEAPANRVVFAAGAIAQLSDEVDRLGARRALVLVTPGHEAEGHTIAASLGARACGVVATARVHVPADIAAAAVVKARELAADCTIGYGGGSTIGLGKMIALELGLPQLALPTTYSGSEMTAVWGTTADGVKRTGRDPRVLPRTVIYDPQLTVGLPPRVTGASGLNALAHAAEALYAPNANPITTLLAEEAIRALAVALPRAVRTGGDLGARGEALYGAYLAGYALGTSTMGLHHQICHALGGAFDLPHAELHALALPHVLRFNAPAATDALARIARALDAADAPSYLRALIAELGLPVSLAELGVPRGGLAAVAARVAQHPYPNPRPIDEASVLRMFESMFSGELPERTI